MANAWLRLWHDMPNDPKWRTIARVSGQPIATVMAVYIHLLVDALTHAGLLIDDEQFDEINIVRGQLVPGGRLGIKITELECA